MGQVSIQCNILLCTQLLYNLSLTLKDISLLVSNSTNCINLFHPIRILASTAASASLSTLNMSPKLNETYPLTQDLHWHQYLHLCILHQLPLQTNVFITLYMLPFFPLHFLCTHFWQLVHCIELLPMPLPQTPHAHLTAFCITFCHYQ